MRHVTHQSRAPELPAVVGFCQYARFIRTDPSENRRRFYLVTWQPALFGGGMLVRTWGRIGATGANVAMPYPDRQSAQPAIERLIRRRLRRRYELVAWE
jgi:predicted DNA-binding WGR domain protein